MEERTRLHSEICPLCRSSCNATRRHNWMGWVLRVLGGRRIRPRVRICVVTRSGAAFRCAGDKPINIIECSVHRYPSKIIKLILDSTTTNFCQHLEVRCMYVGWEMGVPPVSTGAAQRLISPPFRTALNRHALRGGVLTPTSPDTDSWFRGLCVIHTEIFRHHEAFAPPGNDLE